MFHVVSLEANELLRLFRRTLSIILLTTLGQAHAGVLIVAYEGKQAKSEVAIEGDYARIDNSAQPGYILIDMARTRIYAVSDRDKRLVNLTSPAPEPSAHAAKAIATVGTLKVEMHPMGDGPVISGYPTRHYRVMINDTTCYDEYLAIGPLMNPLIRRFVDAMSKASHTENNDVLSVAMDETNLCKAADNLVDDQYPTLGIPMQTVDLSEGITHHITEIKTHARFPKGFFDLPKDYPVYSRRQLQSTTQSTVKATDPRIVHRQQAITQMIKDHKGPVIKDLDDHQPPPIIRSGKPGQTHEKTAVSP